MQNKEQQDGQGSIKRPRRERITDKKMERPRREGGYNPERPRREGGYNPERPRREGGYSSERPRREGGYSSERPRREGGYSSERPRREGGYSSERPRREGGYSSERPRREGGYSSERPRREGGYSSERPRREKSYRSERTYKSFGHKPAPKKTEAPQPKQPKVPGEVRLNKYIANSGLCSRREADTFITTGLVTVNGKVVDTLGVKVTPADDVRVNGQRIKGEPKTYIVMNKPRGYVTTLSDDHAEKSVMDLIAGKCEQRVFPVGRLDKMTMGVLLFTNDGELTEKLTHPSYNRKKIYQTRLDMNLKQSDMEKLVNGIELEDGMMHVDQIAYIDNDEKEIGLEIHSGKNRVVRRLFEALGYKVKKLDRVYFAGLTKKNLKRGQWRFLTEEEVNMLITGFYQ
jgi:23S rRNA pseudouridine2605 synthase